MMVELGLECGSMTEEVGCLVEHIWLEANEEVENVLSCDVTSIKEEQVLNIYIDLNFFSSS
jgi:hypothetical protein